MNTRRKAAIVGTAPSFRLTPWHDRDLYITALNDAYQLRLRRFDEWCEYHPLDQMTFVTPGVPVQADQIPKGHYVRPDGHVEWLKAQAARIPVWLQNEPPADWPANAQRLPVEELERKYFVSGHHYWASGPSFMLMHLHARGFREIHIYGIHLATEAEYRKQRPNLEFLCGRLLGIDYSEKRENGIRTLTGSDVTIVIPEAAPILKHDWKYAYEHEPEPPASAYRAEYKQVVKDKNELMQRLIVWPVGESKDAALETLRRLTVIEEDCADMMRGESLARDYPPIVAVLGG